MTDDTAAVLPLLDALPDAPADVYTLALGPGGVVVAAMRSNVAQTALPGQTVVGVDADTYGAARGAVGLRTWDGHALQPYAPPAAPAAPPASVTRLQGRLQLSRAGLLDRAEAAVAGAGGETAIWYADAQTWRRDDPHIAAIAGALDPPLTSDQVDALFAAAAGIA